jgi:glyoxylase-like metal-dependent hydrolase (beta-lactamase superfamily II)
LLKSFPQAQVICHPLGIKHLIDPEKLWQGSRKVLGKLAEAYGEIVPVPEANISFSEQLGATGIRCFQTPGHAQHHCCYLLDGLLFGGEVAGVHSPVANGIYMRPATPPKFILEVALDSLQRMIELQPRSLIIAHYGLVEPALEYLKIGQKQLKLWVKGVAKNIDLPEENFHPAMINWLALNDRYFGNIEQLSEDIRAREDYFLDNSLRGMRDYVAGLSSAARSGLLESL